MICALKIKIDTKSLSSLNAIQQALVIDINGLVLNANEKISPIVLEFFKECNAKLEIIKVAKDANCIRISGNYCITKSEVQRVLAKLKEIPNNTVAKNTFTKKFSKSLQSYYEKTKHLKDLNVTLMHKKYAPQIKTSQTNVSLVFKAINISNVIIRAGTDFKMISGEETFLRGSNSEHTVFEPEFLALNKISSKSSFTRLKNFILIAKEIELTSQNGCINLERKFDQTDKTKDPKPIFFSFINHCSPNILKMFDENEEVNSEKKFGFNTINF